MMKTWFLGKKKNKIDNPLAEAVKQTKKIQIN